MLWWRSLVFRAMFKSDNCKLYNYTIHANCNGTLHFVCKRIKLAVWSLTHAVFCCACCCQEWMNELWEALILAKSEELKCDIMVPTIVSVGCDTQLRASRFLFFFLVLLLLLNVSARVFRNMDSLPASAVVVSMIDTAIIFQSHRLKTNNVNNNNNNEGNSNTNVLNLAYFKQVATQGFARPVTGF